MFYLQNKCFIFGISRFLCFREIHKFRNLWRHQTLLHNRSYTFGYFFWILSLILSKWNLVKYLCIMILMTIKIKFNSPLLTISKYQATEIWHHWLLSDSSRFLNWKRPGTQSQSSKSLKRYQKDIPFAYIYQYTNLQSQFRSSHYPFFGSWY